MGKIKMPAAAFMGRVRSVPCIQKGIEALGYQITDTPKMAPRSEEGDILVLWNRLPTMAEAADRYEAAGCPVIVCEHGWAGDETYAIARSQHNGAGDWYIGTESRWPVFGIGVKPWRERGDHILVVPQRGMGTPPVAMPREWPDWTVEHLKKITHRPVRVRNPKMRTRDPIERDFADAHCVVTWASGGGIKAILNGIPVFYEMDQWIGEDAAKKFNGMTAGDDLENPYLESRDRMLHRLSWAMWASEEIAGGDPFRCVLSL